MSALTQTEMLEAVVDDDPEETHSSVDSDSETKLISPVVKKQLYSTMDRSPDRSPSTPTTLSKNHPTSNSTKTESRMVKDLNSHILHPKKYLRIKAETCSDLRYFE